jgi:diacylglycerol kinase family enzyme
MSARQVAAIGALLIGLAALVLAVIVAIQEFPEGLIVLGLVCLAGLAGWYGVLRRGAVRAIGLAAGAIAFAAAILLLLDERVVEVALIVGGLVAAGALARAALSRRAHLPAAPAPEHPVLIFNPRSGGGKAERFSLAAEARARGIEAIELRPGEDLGAIARDAISRGADALAMAGGDGSQAIVAALAAEHDLAYACVPAGTRNHFALDLGVDRDDVVGALDALVDGRERVVDLAEVNGQVFVNNVSLGVYAEAVQKAGYRDAKLRTLLDTVPDAIGPSGSGLDLQWTGPSGQEHSSGAVILVSNNRYRLGPAVGSGTRPAIDDGLLGITIAGAPTGRGGRGRLPQRPVREWSAPTFEVRADRPVPAGIDGEAVRLEPPLRFAIRSGVLRVRIAPGHPGTSPSASLPEGLRDSVHALGRVAAGRDPAPATSSERTTKLSTRSRKRRADGHPRG